jgi:D-alanine-D-alanine ligase
MKHLLNIAVVCGGQSSEHEISLKTGQMILKNLNRRKYRPTLVIIDKTGKWRFGDAKAIEIGDAIKKLKRFDLVFIAIHGAFGEDGHFQALLEWIGIPYTGSGVLSSAMTMDKQISNTLYETNGLRVPRYTVIKKNSKDIGIKIPFVIKPVDGGSSVGISIVKSRRNLQSGLQKAFREGGRVMIQEYIRGRELTCGVLEDENGKPFALPPTEIIPKTSTFFDYRAKYKVGGSLEITPPRLPRRKIRELQQMALKAHRILGCQGMSRSDFILKGSTLYVLETNTIPGMTEISLLPQAAKAAGIDFPSMLDLIIAAGIRKS